MPVGRSLDDLVGPDQDRLGDREAERLSGLEVNDELELGGLLDGKVGGFGALEDSVDVASGTRKLSGILRP
jgi:hypothetical protein